MPVFSMALEIPFHDASMEYFCFAVRGRRGSVAGGGPSLTGPALLPRLSDAANFPNWQPIFTAQYNTSKPFLNLTFTTKSTRFTLCLCHYFHYSLFKNTMNT